MSQRHIPATLNPRLHCTRCSLPSHTSSSVLQALRAMQLGVFHLHSGSVSSVYLESPGVSLKHSAYGLCRTSKMMAWRNLHSDTESSVILCKTHSTARPRAPGASRLILHHHTTDSPRKHDLLPASCRLQRFRPLAGESMEEANC